MSTTDWKRDMEHMLEMFDLQATHTLRKMNGHFEALRRPFNEEFRQYFLKISNQRLGMSYAKVDSESWDKQQVGLVENRGGSSHEIVGNNDNGSIADNSIEIPECFIVDPLDGSDLIEIFDSSEEDEMEKTEEQGTMVRKYDTITKAASNTSAETDNGSNDTKNRRSQKNDSSAGKVSAAENAFRSLHNNTQQSSSSSKVMKLSKRKEGKRFKCNQCPSSFDTKFVLKRHQEVHIRERSMGITPDRNGLYSCTHCTRKFHEFRFLTLHLTKSHKNGQYLFYCTNCMSPFTRENEKNVHKNQCQRLRYECYICKSFHTKDKSPLEDHMRRHTGVKPFECAVCNRFFRMRCTLKRHLDFVHGKGARQY